MYTYSNSLAEPLADWELELLMNDNEPPLYREMVLKHRIIP